MAESPEKSAEKNYLLTDACTNSILKLVIFSETIMFSRIVQISVFYLIIEPVVFHNWMMEIEFALKLTNEFFPISGAKNIINIDI